MNKQQIKDHIKKGAIIDLGQTVNGENLFVVLNNDPIDIRYRFDLSRKYEYNVVEFFAPCPFTGEVEYKIIGNIYDIFNTFNKTGKLPSEIAEENEVLIKILNKIKNELQEALDHPKIKELNKGCYGNVLRRIEEFEANNR